MKPQEFGCTDVAKGLYKTAATAQLFIFQLEEEDVISDSFVDEKPSQDECIVNVWIVPDLQSRTLNPSLISKFSRLSSVA